MLRIYHAEDRIVLITWLVSEAVKHRRQWQGSLRPCEHDTREPSVADGDEVSLNEPVPLHCSNDGTLPYALCIFEVANEGSTSPSDCRLPHAKGL